MDDKKGNILVVDDEEVIREMLKTLLEREGYSVSTAENGAEAIDQIRKNFFNAAILDIKLTDMSGMEVMHLIRERYPEACVLMITAYATTETAIKSLEEGVYDYIVKPFDVNRLKLVIKRGLEKQRLALENKQLLESLQEEKLRLESVLEIGKMMSAILNVDELVDFIVKKATEVLKAEKGSVMLVEKQSGNLAISGAKGLSEEIIRSAQLKMGEKIAGWVAERGEALLIKDIETDVRTKRKKRTHYTSKSFLSIPLKHKNKVQGVVNIADKKQTSVNIFNEDDLKFLSIIVNQAAVAMENARLYEEVSNLAITDALTNLFNHRYFQEYLTKEINRARRYQRPLTLVMFDIDNFKSYNDKYGHLMGDALLKEIARILKNNAREVDIVCRYGGEEFMIILPETEAQGAMAIAEKVRKSVESFSQTDRNIIALGKLTISGGVTAYEEKLTKEQLIQRADEALYQAKKEGKNKICVYKVT